MDYGLLIFFGLFKKEFLNSKHHFSHSICRLTTAGCAFMLHSWCYWPFLFPSQSCARDYSLEIPEHRYSLIYLLNSHLYKSMLWIHCDPINFECRCFSFLLSLCLLYFWLVCSIYLMGKKFTHFEIALIRNEMTWQHLNKSLKYYLICIQKYNVSFRNRIKHVMLDLWKYEFIQGESSVCVCVWPNLWILRVGTNTMEIINEIALCSFILSQMREIVAFHTPKQEKKHHFLIIDSKFFMCFISFLCRFSGRMTVQTANHFKRT